MRIDAHQHFWTLARADYGWLSPALPALYRDFGPGDLAPLLACHGIDRTIVVQAAPTVAETRHLLQIAPAVDFVAGVVGWVDLEASDAPSVIEDLARDPLLVGLRPMVQDIVDDDWLLSGRLTPAFETMQHHGLVFDALVLPRHLPRLLRVVSRHPDLVVVVDHAAKPRIRDRLLEPWRGDLSAIAAHANTYCKLSGLVTEAAPAWQTADLVPYVDAIVEMFGPARLLWGSDWPVVNLAGGYERWMTASISLLDGVSDEERSMILGDNAARVYLGRKPQPLRREPA